MSEQWAYCEEPPSGGGVKACGWNGEMSQLVVDEPTGVTRCPNCGSCAIVEEKPRPALPVMTRHREDLIALLKEAHEYLVAECAILSLKMEQADYLEDLRDRIAAAVDPTEPAACPDCGKSEISIDGRGSWLCTAAGCGGGDLK